MGRAAASARITGASDDKRTMRASSRCDNRTGLTVGCSPPMLYHDNSPVSRSRQTGRPPSSRMPSTTSLDLDRETMRRLGHRVADIVADHLATLRSQPVITGLGRRETDAMLRLPPPRHGTDFETLMVTLREQVFAQH